MKRFHFELDSVRRYKERQKRQLENEVAGVCRELTLEQNQLQELTSELQRLLEPKHMESQEFLKNRLAELDYSDRIRREILQKQAQVKELQQRCERLHSQYREISTELESLETLREQRYAEHQSLASKQQQQELNDHITHGWLKRATEDSP